MRVTVRMSADQRRAEIIQAVRRVFVEKGFHGTTTRELAQAAGVSEALLFKHFPSKEALYTAIQHSCVKHDGAKLPERFETLPPCSASLVLLVRHLISHMLAERTPDDNERSLVLLVLRSLMNEGEFARLAVQTGPAHWVRKVGQCLEAAIAVGDAVPNPVRPEMAGWFTHMTAVMTMIHLLPRQTALDFGVSREDLIRQMVWFSLRGMGVKDDVIRHYCAAAAAADLEPAV